MYVVLNRFTSINESYLIVKYNKAALKVNVSAKKVYERLRKRSLFKFQPQMCVIESSIIISFLNTRSLKKHFIHIVLGNDILCLTETQLETKD